MRAWNIPTLLLRVTLFGCLVALCATVLLDGGVRGAWWAFGFVAMTEITAHGMGMAVQPHRLSTFILCLIASMAVSTLALAAAALTGALALPVLIAITPALLGYGVLLIAMPVII
jgi:hypothetical protein